MALLKVLLFMCTLSCLQGVMSDEGLQSTTLPVQCDSSVIQLSPIVYIAVGTNYSNCTLRGLAGTVIRGVMGSAQDYQTVNRGLTILSGSMVLDRVSLWAGSVQVEGDEIIVRDSNITTRPQTREAPYWGFRVLGGRVALEGVEVRSVWPIELTNTSMTFSNSRITPISQDNGVEVFGSTISLQNSSIHAGDDQRIAFKSSMVNLSDSFLQLDHGSFLLTDSHATLTRSAVDVSIGTQGMRITNSSVIASCGGIYHTGRGGVFTTGGSRIVIDTSKMTFHNCSCDISRAISDNGAWGMYDSGIRIDASSVHFEGCNAPKPVYPTLV